LKEGNIMADTNTQDVINQIVSLLQEESGTLVNSATQDKITKWTNEIAPTTSSWVKIRDTIYLITISWAAMKAQGKIREALGKLSK
jgi:hypothetical protein